MKTTHRSLLTWMLVVALAALTVREIGARGAAPAAPAPAAGKSIAVVNIVDLFDKLLEKASADTDLANMKKNSQDELAKRKAEVDKLKDALGTYKEGSDQFNKAQDDYALAAINLDSYGKFLDAKYQNETQLRTMALYKKINDAVADYAKANGIGLVFVADSADLDKLRSPDQFSAVVTTRKLMYFDPAFDITPALLQKMNTDFQLAAPKPAARPPAAGH